MKIKAYSYVTVLDVSDNSIASVDVMYYLSDSNAELIGGSWQTDPPPWQDGKYYWQKTVTTFTDPLKPASETNPICITGGRGGTGVGIQSITNMYLATEQSNGITLDTPGWSSEFQPISPSKKYLWNYEIFIYTDQSEYKTEPCIMGVYGDSGSSGKGILSIQNLYLTTSLGSGVDTDTKGWSTTPTPTSDTNTYLWNYDIITYTDQSTYETTPHIIGTHGAIGPKGDKGDPGEKGESGTGVESITEEYYLSDSKTELVGGSWTTDPPTWSYGKYIWTRSKIVYKNPTSTVYTTPICDTSWEVVDSIKIGGKNLLLNTSSIIAYNPEINNWTMDSNGQVVINEVDKATDSIHIKTSNSSNANSGLMSLITGIDFKRGETYTFSCAIRGSYDASKLFGCQIYYQSIEIIEEAIQDHALQSIQDTNNQDITSIEKNIEKVYDFGGKTLWTDNGDGINDGINTAHFQRRYFTFTIPHDYDEDTNLLGINICCPTMDIYIRNLQLERGNKPTDWKMAEEDVQSQIQSVTTTMSGVSSKVDQIEQNIINKIWVTDINEYIDNYDKSTVEVINNKLTEQIQNLDGIQTTVSAMQTTLETKADGSIVTELTNRVSQAQQDITGFKQTVEETYATKDENSSVRTYAEQLANKFSWLVSSNSSSTSLTLTDSMIDAMTKQFVVKSPDGKRVVIENGIVKTDFLQSHNYVAGTGTPKYSSSGTFFNMADGALYAKNFVIDPNGNAYLRGTVNATAGKIGDCTIANGKLTIPAANITGKLEADHIIVGSSSLDDDLKDLINGIYAQFDGEGSTLGYCHLAQIKITSAYTNDAIVIGINQRGNGYSQCCITFQNINGTDPALDRFLQIGTAEWRIAKASAGLWNLYVKKYEVHDSITVTEYQNVRAGKTLTWICENAEVPAGATYATQCASFVEIDSTAGGTAGSGALITSGAANSINREMNIFINNYHEEIAGIQDSINRKPETWYQDTDPALEWTAKIEEAIQDENGESILDTTGKEIVGILEKEKISHEGDIWKNSETNVEYIFRSGVWIEMPIPNAVMDKIENYKNTALTASEANKQTIQMVQDTVGGLELSVEATNDLAQAAQDVAEITNGKLTPILNWCKEDGGKTYIDGGWIFANSIAGNSIMSNSITAVQISAEEIRTMLIKAETIVGSHGQINLGEGTFAYWRENSMGDKISGIGWTPDGELELIGSGTFSGTVTCSYLTAIQSGRIANWYFNNQCIYNSYNRNNNYNPNGSHNYDGAWAGAGIYFGEKGLSISSPTKPSEFRVTVDGDFTGTYATITGVLDAEVVQSVNGYKVGMKFATEQDSTTYSGFHVISYQSQNKRILIGRLSDRNSSPVTNRGYFAFDDDAYIRVNGSIYLTSSNSITGTGYISCSSVSCSSISSTSISASESISSNNTLAAGGNIFTNGTLILQVGSNVPTISNGKILVRTSDNGAVGVQASSSMRYKNYINVVTAQEAMNLLNLDVVTFKYKDGYLTKNDIWNNKVIPGFFAEDVEKINPILCTYDNNVVEDWNHRTMIPYMLKIDQIHHDDINQLKQENDSLKQRLSKIESLLAKLNITEEI